MLQLHGEGISPGMALGTFWYCPSQEDLLHLYAQRPSQDPQKEFLRFQEACTQAGKDLNTLYERVAQELGEENAQLFEVHRMMLEDTDYLQAIKEAVLQNLTAESAVCAAFRQFSLLFSSMEDPYMQQRAADVKDISLRLLELLSGEKTALPSGDSPFILAAEELTPSQTARLDPAKIAGILTRKGSPLSHGALFARTMGIPAVSGLGEDVGPRQNGTKAFLNGETGEVLLSLSPEQETSLKVCLSRQRHLKNSEKSQASSSQSQIASPIALYANLGSLADLPSVLQAGAQGIGLFRSEFLFLEKPFPPTEEEQFQAYRSVAEAMNGKPVVIRTLDAGGDKPLSYLKSPPESNPALGMRGIRFGFLHEPLLKKQLRALYRASAFGNLSILFPMISNLWEVRKIRELACQVQDELRQEGFPLGTSVKLGIMVETPAAALLSHELAKLSDFFSIGTNDLMQYTLAVDRQDAALEPYRDPHSPAVLELIRITAENAHKNGIPVSICGALASHTSFLPYFLQAKIDALSVPAGDLPLLRQAISALQ